MHEAFDKLKFVLLADDDDDDTMLFIEAAEEVASDINVVIASNGQKLLNLLEDGRIPDVIFLDLNMPMKGGLECLKLIREKPHLENVPAVIYSTSRNKTDIDACYKAGANFYIIKPFDFEDIIVVLKKLFSLLSSKETVKGKRENFVITTRESI